MLSFKTFIIERGPQDDGYISKKELRDLEKFGDRLLKQFGVDIEFTKHFADRLNDPRNKPGIKANELKIIFLKIANNQAKKIKKNPNIEAVIKDMQMDLNLPVVIKYDPRKKEFDVISKTIMRKKNFRTSSKVIPT